MVGLFVKSWKGEASLAQAFWLVFILVSLSMSFLFFFYPTHNDLLGRVGDVLLPPYLIFGAICVWRCEKNASEFFIVLSKAVVVVCLIHFIPSLIF